MSDKTPLIDMKTVRERFSDRTVGYVAQRRFYATLLPLIEVEGAWHVLFEVRSDDVEQPGEICFPGGAIEEGESPLDCAIRETFEEIGVTKSQIEILGENDRMISGPNRVVYNFVGILHVSFEELTMNHAESQELFTIPLDYFLTTTPIIHHADMVEHTREDFPYEQVHYEKDANWSVGIYDIVFYDYEKDPPLWGLTAAFMRRFVEILKG